MSLLPAFGAQNQAVQPALRVVLFADSLLSGWHLQENESFAGKLEQKLQQVGYRQLRVINASIDSETTSGAYSRIASIDGQDPDVVVLAIGSNDLLRGVSPDVIESNLSNIASHFRSEGVYVVLAGFKALPGMGPEYAENAREVFRNAAVSAKVAFYPDVMEGIDEDPTLVLADGYHPNASGVDVVVEGMYRLVDEGLRWRWQVRTGGS